VPDSIFEHPRLVGVYDALDPVRSDLEVYADLVAELGVRRVLDLGCGTGTFALMLAAGGLRVTGVDPAAGSLAFARDRPGAQQVDWVLADGGSLPEVQVELVIMTGNVVQAIVKPDAWEATLRGVRRVLVPGGHLVFETRDPAHRAWREWNRRDSHRVTNVSGQGSIATWVDVMRVEGPLVSIRHTWVFERDGAVLTSDSTLRFRDRDEVVCSLLARGFTVAEVRDAPDRPGREFVFVARSGLD
jgi:SAM-dependent methyltransferase